MKKLIAKFIIVVALLLALLTPVAASGRAQALVACQPLVHFPCTGGGIVCVDRHGRVFDRFHPHSHCVAI